MRAVNVILLAWLWVTPAQGQNLAIGDSLAVGYGQASHVRTIARVGASSCAIARMVPAGHFGTVLVSAGTNDPPGACLEAIRDRLSADRVVWVIPVNGARSHVLSVAAQHRDGTFFYSPSRRGWPHPAAYRKVI